VQAIVDAYQVILAQANDVDGTAGNNTAATTDNATAQQYATIGANIGLASTDTENLNILNDIVGCLQTVDVNSIAKINELARIANAIQSVAATGTSTPRLPAPTIPAHEDAAQILAPGCALGIRRGPR
jgi:hypothetical protein